MLNMIYNKYLLQIHYFLLLFEPSQTMGVSYPFTVLSVNQLVFFFLIIYLDVLGLSCSMRDQIP